MNVLIEDNIKFMNAQDKIYEKAKRLLYKYGDQTPFTEEEMKKVYKLLEIIDAQVIQRKRD